jgi:putative nucleotidyltransferase with HDIG domain
MLWPELKTLSKNKTMPPKKNSSNSDSNSGQDPQRRERYSDHSQKFSDWAQKMGWERTPLGSFIVFLDEKLRIRRYAFVLFYSLTLAFVLNFEWSTPLNYQVGETAKIDIKSPLAFDMVDEVTTEERRQKAEAGVPLIFDFDPSVFMRVSSKVYQAFRAMRVEVQNVKWPKAAVAHEEKVKEFFIHKGEFEKILGISVPDYVFEWLVQNKFGARFENAIIRNLAIWYDQKIIENFEKTIPDPEGVITARVVQKNGKGREFQAARREILDAGNLDNFLMKDRKGLEKVADKDRDNVLVFAHLLIYPNLTLNKQEMASRRQAVRDALLPITISVKKNQTIVTKDSSVQPFHMAMIREIELRKTSRHKDIVTVATGLFFFALIVVFFQYLRRFAGVRVKVDSKDVLAMGMVLLLQVVIVKVFLFLTENAFSMKFGAFLPSAVYLYAAPLAAGPMLVGLVIQSGEVVWLFTAFSAIVMGLLTELNFPFLLVTLAGGIAGARGVYACKKRNDLYWAGLRTAVVNSVVIGLILTVAHIEQEGFAQELWACMIAGFLGGNFSAFVALTLVPLIESVFNYTTDVKLLELSNLNHPLLKEMIVKAPGTYHHSMMVGSMVEAAAEEIGANPLLGKVMCYYHDIGKMPHANYFIENQKQGQNPHDHISPYMSKTLLIAHVKDGVELGVEHKLGKPIIDGILQHHGTTLISFFFHRAVEQRKVEDQSEVAQEEFRYPGPKPQFREAALCMLADSIEAAARSLDEPTPVRLQNIVRNIIQRKFMDGQLDECNLTLRDLSRVEAAFQRILLGIYHQRIDYPRQAGGGASEAPPVSGSGVSRS